MKIPEKWPSKAERQRIYAAMRVLGVPMACMYVMIRPEHVGKHSLVHYGNEPITEKMVGQYAWLDFTTLTGRQQKLHWKKFRNNVLERLSSTPTFSK